MIKRIHLISGPRNISTALMYSFGNRLDCAIVDEPMYAHYLIRNNIDHPGREETVMSLPQDMETIKRDLIFTSIVEDPSFYFIKNMAHHFEGVQDWNFLLELNNLFLIRNPYQLIASFAQVIPHPTMLDIGLEKEWELFQWLMKRGQQPIVLDSNDILDNPELMVRKLCEALQMPFSNRMLSWEAGPRKEDGPWAKYWYHNTHQSTGFVKQKTSSRELPEHLLPLYQQAKVFYEALSDYRLKI